MTIDDVREMLRKAVAPPSSQRAFARKHKITAAYVGDVIRGKKPGPAILRALGLEVAPAKPTTYRSVR